MKQPVSLHIILLSLSFQVVQVSAQNWSSFGYDAASTKFSPLTELDSTNVADLRIVWQFDNPDRQVAPHAIDGGWTYHSRMTPLAVDGVIYGSTPLNIIYALDAVTGKQLWQFDPRVWEHEHFLRGYHRGVALWDHPDGGRRVQFGTSNGWMYSLDAATGQPDSAFGTDGRIDLTQDLGRPVDRRIYGNMSPPVIVDGVAVIGSALIDWWAGRDLPPLPPPGDVRGYDAATGKRLWTFHTVPADGEFGVDTWPENPRDMFGAANAWAPLTADEELGYVYLPLGTISSDYYGGDRPGDNLFGDSIVCLDVRTGKRVWHFQLIHHGVFDYDTNAAPILLDVVVDGTPRKIVAQTSKQGFLYVFDRVTGEPLWPIEERPVPASTVPGEVTSPTQPFPTKPAPYARQGLTDDDLIDFTPELRREALEIVSDYDRGPLYTPPSERGTYFLPGIIGGSSWAGAVADTGRGWLYVASITSPSRVSVQPTRPDEGPYSRIGQVRVFTPGPHGLPLTKPPYGSITAINLNTGEHEWQIATGVGPKEHPKLRDLDLPDLGWPTDRFLMGTPTLLFDVSEVPWGQDYYIDPVSYLQAYDPDDGRLIARLPLPKEGYGNPITYMAGGRQHVLASTWGGDLYSMAIPRDGEKLPQQVVERTDETHAGFYAALERLDAGDIEGLRVLLQQSPHLIRAKGFLDRKYPQPDLRHASLLHMVTGNPIRTRLPANAIALARLLLDAGADPNALTTTGISPLTSSIYSDQLYWAGQTEEMLQTLVAGGADPDQGGGRLLYMGLTYRDRPELGEMVQALGATPDLRFAAGLGLTDSLANFVDGDGALTAAACQGYHPGRSGRPTDEEILADALGFAVWRGHVEAAQWLLDRGADPDLLTPGFLWPDDQGTTALHKAVIGQHVDTVQLLLDAGADVMIRELNEDTTALMRASWNDDEEIQRLVAEAQARYTSGSAP